MSGGRVLILEMKIKLIFRFYKNDIIVKNSKQVMEELLQWAIIKLFELKVTYIDPVVEYIYTNFLVDPELVEVIHKNDFDVKCLHELKKSSISHGAIFKDIEGIKSFDTPKRRVINCIMVTLHTGDETTDIDLCSVPTIFTSNISWEELLLFLRIPFESKSTIEYMTDSGDMEMGVSLQSNVLFHEEEN